MVQENFQGRNRFILGMLVLAIFIGAAPAWGSTYLLYSQWGGTWHDANKSFADDSLMCWAAAASNILDWGRWDTVSDATERKILGEFKEHWTNNRGWQSWAWQWWLNGRKPPYNTYAYPNVAGGGNYFPGTSLYSYYTTASGSGEIASMDSLMHKGYGISLVIGPNHTNQHAITAWGFDYNLINGKKNYTALYITDSDDRVTALKRMGLAYSTTRGWYLTSGYTNWDITGVYAFSRRPGSAIAPYSSAGEGGLPIAAAADDGTLFLAETTLAREGDLLNSAAADGGTLFLAETTLAGEGDLLSVAAPIMPTWSFVATGLLLLLILRRRRKFSL